MFLLKHPTFYSLLIINGDPNLITKHIWETSDTIPKGFKRHFYLFPSDCCDLDPGGMIFMKTPRKEFEIDGIKFEIKISKAGEMRRILEDGLERVPGYIRFWTFNYFVILPKSSFEKLLKHLKEIEYDDAALNAELHELDVKDVLRRGE